MALKVPVNKSDHHRGSLNAPVVLLEFGDFECPYCAMTAPTIDKLLADFGDDLCLVYRHFPLRSVHPFAEYAALASEAADQQGQFWPMHRLLFENYDMLSEENILTMAKKINLDIERFNKDMLRPDLMTRLQLDFMSGVRSGVNGTPTLYLNGIRFEGPPMYKLLRAAISDVLETKKQPYESPTMRPPSPDNNHLSLG